MTKKEFLLEQISQVIDKCAHDENELFHHMDRDCYTCWRNVLNEKEKG